MFLHLVLCDRSISRSRPVPPCDFTDSDQSFICVILDFDRQHWQFLAVDCLAFCHPADVLDTDVRFLARLQAVGRFQLSAYLARARRISAGVQNYPELLNNRGRRRTRRGKKVEGKRRRIRKKTQTMHGHNDNALGTLIWLAMEHLGDCDKKFPGRGERDDFQPETRSCFFPVLWPPAA